MGGRKKKNRESLLILYSDAECTVAAIKMGAYAFVFVFMGSTKGFYIVIKFAKSGQIWLNLQREGELYPPAHAARSWLIAGLHYTLEYIAGLQNRGPFKGSIWSTSITKVCVDKDKTGRSGRRWGSCNMEMWGQRERGGGNFQPIKGTRSGRTWLNIMRQNECMVLSVDLECLIIHTF